MIDKTRLDDAAKFFKDYAAKHKVAIITPVQPAPLRDGAHICRESATPPPTCIIIDYTSLLKPNS